MKSRACILVRYGDSKRAFEAREIDVPDPGPGEIRIRSEAFGLNYADVMARLGLYREAPSPPALIGYETLGVVEAVGSGVDLKMVGKRVVAFCRFKGYAAYVNTSALASMEIPNDWESGKALAMVTQYSTAWYASMIATTLREKEWVLINSAAGGVGTALMQIARWKKCRIIGTSRSDSKLKMIRDAGADEALDYRDAHFTQRLKKISGGGMDVAFDAVGGTTFRKSFRALTPTGRMVAFGAASRSDLHFLPVLRLVLQFGFMHPALLMMQSRSMIGINMLRVSEHQPYLLRESLEQVCRLTQEGVLQPVTGKIFPASALAEAHEWLGSGMSHGKIVLTW